MEERFISLWEKFRHPLELFIRKRISNEQDMEDILQDAFFRIFNNIDSLKNSDKIHAWIYRIARNSIVDHYRKHNAVPKQKELPEEYADPAEIASSSKDDIASCLKVLIESLPEKYKEAILLTEYQNLTQREFGETIGISLSGAKSRVQRARLLLKESLLGCCSFEFDRNGNLADYSQKKAGCQFC